MRVGPDTTDHGRRAGAFRRSKRNRRACSAAACSTSCATRSSWSARRPDPAPDPVDLDGLDIGDSVHISAVTLPPGRAADHHRARLHHRLVAVRRPRCARSDGGSGRSRRGGSGRGGGGRCGRGGARRGARSAARVRHQERRQARHRARQRRAAQRPARHRARQRHPRRGRQRAGRGAAGKPASPSRVVVPEPGHAPHRRARQSRRPLRAQPAQCRLHGGGRDRPPPSASAPFAPSFRARSPRATIGGERVYVLKPQTFMNRFRATRSARRRASTRSSPSEIAVIHDEIDLAPGKLKVKRGGGTAGHNGLRSIDAAIGRRFLAGAPRHRPSRR